MRFGVFSSVFVVETLDSLDLVPWEATAATRYFVWGSPVLGLAVSGHARTGGRQRTWLNLRYCWALFLIFGLIVRADPLRMIEVGRDFGHFDAYGCSLGESG